MDGNRYDVIVTGVGGIGSATTYQLARRGADVLGLEQFDVPHTKGSSHGGTRMIRLSYFNEPRYVPLLYRTYELWDDLEQQHAQGLLYRTGSLDIGPSDGEIVRRAKHTCNTYDISHRVLSATEVNDQFPGFDVPAEYEAVYQDAGGFLDPEQCIVAHVNAAHSHGATVRARERVMNWTATADSVTVETTRRSYTADTLVITTGAWAYQTLDIFDDLRPELRTMAWFQPGTPDAYTLESFPVYHMDLADQDERVYGFPTYKLPGVKLGRYGHPSGHVDPDAVSRTPTTEEEQTLRTLLEQFTADAAGPTMSVQRCLITNTPDDDFIVDFHPEYENVVLGVGGSGHGFKFAAVLGEILSDLAINSVTAHDIELFAADRF